MDKLKIRLKLDDVAEGTEKLAIEINQYSDFREEGSWGTATLDLLDMTNAEEVITINSPSRIDYMNLMEVYTGIKGAPTKSVNAKFIIGAAVTVTGHGINNGPTGPAIVSGTGWPVGSKLYVENLGKVYGGGGSGSKSIYEFYDPFNAGINSDVRRKSSAPPTDGWPAALNQMANGVTMYVINKGTMMSGGGGGGRGEDVFYGPGHEWTIGSATVLGGWGLIPPAEGSGGSYGGRKGTYDVSNPEDAGYGVWLFIPVGDSFTTMDGLEYRGVNVSGLGAPAAQPRWTKNVDMLAITAGQAHAYALRPSGSNVDHHVVGGAGGKGGDAGMDGEAGHKYSFSASNQFPPMNPALSDLTECAGGKAGFMTSGNVVFTNQGGTVRSRDYK